MSANPPAVDVIYGEDGTRLSIDQGLSLDGLVNVDVANLQNILAKVMDTVQKHALYVKTLATKDELAKAKKELKENDARIENAMKKADEEQRTQIRRLDDRLNAHKKNAEARLLDLEETAGKHRRELAQINEDMAAAQRVLNDLNALAKKHSKHLEELDHEAEKIWKEMDDLREELKFDPDAVKEVTEEVLEEHKIDESLSELKTDSIEKTEKLRHLEFEIMKTAPEIMRLKDGLGDVKMVVEGKADQSALEELEVLVNEGIPRIDELDKALNKVVRDLTDKADVAKVEQLREMMVQEIVGLEERMKDIVMEINETVQEEQMRKVETALKQMLDVRVTKDEMAEALSQKVDVEEMLKKADVAFCEELIERLNNAVEQQLSTMQEDERRTLDETWAHVRSELLSKADRKDLANLESKLRKQGIGGGGGMMGGGMGAVDMMAMMPPSTFSGGAAGVGMDSPAGQMAAQSAMAAYAAVSGSSPAVVASQMKLGPRCLTCGMGGGGPASGAQMYPQREQSIPTNRMPVKQSKAPAVAQNRSKTPTEFDFERRKVEQRLHALNVFGSPDKAQMAPPPITSPSAPKTKAEKENFFLMGRSVTQDANFDVYSWGKHVYRGKGDENRIPMEPTGANPPPVVIGAGEISYPASRPSSTIPSAGGMYTKRPNSRGAKPNPATRLRPLEGGQRGGALTPDVGGDGVIRGLAREHSGPLPDRSHTSML
eukprot:Rmarinus@m.12630